MSCRDIWGDVERRMAGLTGPWIAGDQFTVVDGYAFVFWRWGNGPYLAYEMAKDFPQPGLPTRAGFALARPFSVSSQEKGCLQFER